MPFFFFLNLNLDNYTLKKPIIFPYLAKELQKYLLELIFIDFYYTEMLGHGPIK